MKPELTVSDRLRLHRRAVFVLEALESIEDVLRAHSQEWFQRGTGADQGTALARLQSVDANTYETEARLALCPLRGGAR